MKSRLMIIVMVLINYACSSSHQVILESSPFDELNNQLKGENVTILLNNEEEVEGIYQELNNDNLAIININNGSPQTFPTRDINKIKSRNHLLGAFKGLLGGALLGIPLTWGVGQLTHHSLKYVGFTFLASPIVGLAWGLIQGDEIIYVLDRGIRIKNYTFGGVK